MTEKRCSCKNKVQFIERLLTFLIYTLILLFPLALIVHLIPILLPVLVGSGTISGILGIAFPLCKSAVVETRITFEDIIYIAIFGILMVILFILVVLVFHDFLTSAEGAILILLFYGMVSLGVFLKVPHRAGVRIHGLFLRGNPQ